MQTARPTATATVRLSRLSANQLNVNLKANKVDKILTKRVLATVFICITHKFRSCKQTLGTLYTHEVYVL